ncbi:MAG: restriction endonuclease subunit S [Oscillospiraceae bacterium]
MKNEQNAPKIRFKGFTDAWELRELGDIVGIYDGVHQTPNYQNSGIMFLSVENIATLKSSKFISEEDFKRDYKVYPQENDILMTRIGDVGTTNVVTDNGLKAYYVSLALLKYKGTDPYFLSNAIQSDYVQKGLANRTLKTAIPMKINKDEIGKVSVMLPLSATEQQQIGTYFRTLDHLITLHQRKCETLQKLKKSMLQKMFPKNGSCFPEIRFAGFTDAWELREFSQLYKKVAEKNDLSFGTDKIISVANMYFKADTKESSDDYMKTYNIMRMGDIAFEGNKSKNYAHGRFVENTIGDGIVSHVFDVFRPITDYDLFFWKYMINNEGVMGRIMTRCTKASTMMTNLVADDFLKETISIPSIEEQRQIGAYFRTLDHLITLHQRKLETLKKLKKAMLQKMFI